MRDLLDLLFSLCGFVIMVVLFLLFLVFGHALLGLAVGFLTILTSVFGVTLSLIISIFFPIIIVGAIVFAIFSVLKKRKKYF